MVNLVLFLEALVLVACLLTKWLRAESPCFLICTGWWIVHRALGVHRGRVLDESFSYGEITGDADGPGGKGLSMERRRTWMRETIALYRNTP